MTFRERIEILLNVQMTKFKTSMQNIRSEMASAQTGMGKFHAGAKASFGMAQQYAGQFAIAAGAAMVAFGVKSVTAFVSAAKAAKDFGTASGLSTEQASRWIAVADDYEVSAGALTTSLAKVNKTLDDAKWSKYGVATRDAEGALRPVNDILLDTFDMLGKVRNKTDQARIGNDLFGKGWSNLAPMIGKSRSEYERMLAAVEKGQVITDEESEKAEKARLAWDGFTDAVGELGMSLGETLSNLAPVVDAITTLLNKVQELGTWMGSEKMFDPELFSEMEKFGLEYSDFLDDLEAGRKALAEAKAAANPYIAEMARLGEGMVRLHAQQQDVTEETERQSGVMSLAAMEQRDLWEAITDKMQAESDAAEATEDSTEATEESTDAAKRAADAHLEVVEAVQDRIDRIKELYNEEQSQLDQQYAFEQSLRDLADRMSDYNETLADSEASTSDVEDATFDTAEGIRQSAKAYAEAQGAADNSKKSIDLQIESLQGMADTLAPGSPLRAELLRYIADLQKIPKSVNTNLTLNKPPPGGTNKGNNVPTFAGPDGGGLPPGTVGDVFPTGAVGAEQSEDDLMAAKFELGDISAAAYEAYLSQRLKSEKKYSAAYMALYRLIRGLKEDAAAASQAEADAAEQAAAAAAAASQAEIDAADALQKHLYDSGIITLEQYKAYLVGRQANLDQYSAEAQALWAEIISLDKQAQDDAQDAAEKSQKEHLDRMEKAEEEAAAKAAFRIAARGANAAQAEMDAAALDYMSTVQDKDATDADKASAKSAYEKAQEAFADALYRRADAGANQAGFKDGSKEWADSVRWALTQDMANAPGLSPFLLAIMDGLPQFAKGGIVPGAPGSAQLVVAHGGEKVLTAAQQKAEAPVTYVFNVLGSIDRAAAKAINAGLRQLERAGS